MQFNSIITQRMCIRQWTCSLYFFNVITLGNEGFKNGNFASAVKAYTKCIGLKVNDFTLSLHNLTYGGGLYPLCFIIPNAVQKLCRFLKSSDGLSKIKRVFKS